MIYPLIQQTQINIGDYNICKCVLNKESHVKRYCEHLFFAAYIISSKFNGIVDVVDVFIFQYCSQALRLYNSGSPAISGGLLDVNVCSAVYFTINILLYILLLSLFYIFFLCRQKETKNSAHGTLS